MPTFHFIRFCLLLFLVKEEPMEDENSTFKTGVPLCKAPTVKKPPEKKEEFLPELLESLRISGEDTLFFVQLPDTLPGQPLSQESRPVRTEVQTEDGHMLLVKDKSQVCGRPLLEFKMCLFRHRE